MEGSRISTSGGVSMGMQRFHVQVASLLTATTLRKSLIPDGVFDPNGRTRTIEFHFLRLSGFSSLVLENCRYVTWTMHVYPVRPAENNWRTFCIHIRRK